MPSMSLLAAGAIGAGVGIAIYIFKKKPKQPQNVKLTYFDIAAAPGEKVRLALTLMKVPFTDNRIKFPDWAALKPTTKYGSLPIMEVDGEMVYQSGAMLRYAGRLGDGSLLPVDDVAMCIKIDEMLGVGEDLQRAWTPALYLGMGRHASFGYPAEWPAKAEVVTALREKFVQEELPKYMTYLTNELSATGAFLCGAKPTIADCQLFPQVFYFTKGVADHVPKDCLAGYPVVVAWLDRMKAIPEVKAFMGC